MKAMTAAEANKLAVDSLKGSYFNSAMYDIYCMIEERSRKGYKYIHRSKVDSRISGRVISELTSKGYEVDKCSESDLHNDFININWFGVL